MTMPMPKMAVLAEGGLATGQRWALRAGGTSSDFYTFLETIHPDGHRDEGGMGGPPLYAGSLMNTYSGSSDREMCRVLVRASPRVAVVQVHVDGGDQFCLRPVAARPDLGLVFFAALLPPSAVLVSVTAIGEDGQVPESLGPGYRGKVREGLSHQRFDRVLHAELPEQARARPAAACRQVTPSG